jgi:hypothetical protein
MGSSIDFLDCWTDLQRGISNAARNENSTQQLAAGSTMTAPVPAALVHSRSWLAYWMSLK